MPENLTAKRLPIFDCLSALKSQLAQTNRGILIAPPGAGKTTHVPLSLLKEEWLGERKVLVLEPRRLAARSAAAYMATLLNEKVGETVGYRVRSDTQVSSRTKIELITEGVFIRMALADPELSGVGAVLFDEFHERNLEGDLGLALAIDIQEGLREDLRILPMSATLDGVRVSEILSDAPIIESEGQSFPVDLIYRPRQPDVPIESAVAGAIVSVLSQYEGDVLAFVPGARDIRRTIEILTERLPDRILVLPLYGGLDHAGQDLAVKPSGDGKRKIVVATSVAETSITIDGVQIVIDSGLARVPRFDPVTGLTRLQTERASISSVDQRMGRAGRTRSGVAVRLWHQGQNGSLLPHPRPEILEADLTSLVLALAAWGVRDPNGLKWLDLPPSNSWRSAKETLIELGALDQDGVITAKGKNLQKTGNPPNLANMIHESSRFGSALRASMLAAILTERGLGGNSTDLSHRLARFSKDSSKKARSLKAGIEKSLSKLKRVAGPNHKKISDGAILSLAFPDRIAKARNKDGIYKLVNGRGAILDDRSTLGAFPFLVVADLQGTAGNARIVSAATISFEEIIQLHGDRIQTERRVYFDSSSKQVKAVRLTTLGQVRLNRAPAPLTGSDNSGQVLCDAISDSGLNLINWDKATKQFLARAQFLHYGNSGAWPDLSESWLRAHLDDWLLPYIEGVTSIANITPTVLKNALASTIGYSRIREMDAEAPTHYTAPSGSRIPIIYDGDEAILSIRVQELFGLPVHPSVGNVPMVLELLSPAHRLIQKTADLPAFWAGSWKDVRSDMRGRYPKHHWPEDPTTAQPTARAKPRGS